MSKQLSAKIVVNSVGAIAATIVAGWVIYSMLASDAPAVCEGRYASSTRFAFTDEAGQPLSDSELQARVGSNEWGVLDNSSIVAGKRGAPSKYILEVNIQKGTGSGLRSTQPRGGISFVWSPFDMKQQPANAACLSYSLFLPPDFQFGAGGTLPGLFIGTDFDPRGGPEIGAGAGARLGWQKDGVIGVNLQFAGKDGWQNPPVVHAQTSWPRGRWVAVEQEVILNSAGKKDGMVRLWLDGMLAAENKSIGLRGDESLTLSGVLADVHYGTLSNSGLAPKDTQIRMTPFVLRWQ